MKLVKGLFLSCVGVFSLSSLAHDFSRADELFKNRANSFERSTEARKAYEETLNLNLAKVDKVYAVSQMARLDLYRGAMLPNIELKQRKKVLEQCVNTVETIKSTGRQEYYYYHLACVAFRGKLSSMLGRISWALKLKKAQHAALESLKTGVAYEGGGILRVLSAVRGNRKAKALKLYNPAEALDFSTRALETPRTTVRPFPEDLSGRDYHENSFYLGQAQIAVGVENEDRVMAMKGLNTIQETMARLDELEELDELPKGREPETNYYRKQMSEMTEKVSSCMSETKWRSCLIKKLN